MSEIQDYSVGLPPTLSLNGKNAIVTGSSRGIGARIALELAARGANVAVHYTSERSTVLAETIAKQIQKLGRSSCVIRCDLQKPECGEKIVQEALRGLQTKTIEILVNNAALGEPRGPTSVESGWSVEEFDRVMRVNVYAPMQLVKAVLPHLSASANRIINISSIGARLNFPNYCLYSASKAGLDSLTRTWAKELAIKYHCTVNGVLVGPTATETAPDSEARSAAKMMTTAERRLGATEDVSEIVAWLASEGSRWVNGDTIGCNGGIVIA